MSWHQRILHLFSSENNIILSKRGKSLKQTLNLGKNHQRNYTSQGFYSEAKEKPNIPHLNFPDPIFRANHEKISSVRNSNRANDMIIWGHKNTSRDRQAIRDTLLTIARDEPLLTLKSVND